MARGGPMLLSDVLATRRILADFQRRDDSLAQGLSVKQILSLDLISVICAVLTFDGTAIVPQVSTALARHLYTEPRQGIPGLLSTHRHTE